MLNASSITMYDTSKARVKNREADWFSKISSLGIENKTLCFWFPKTQFTCGQKGNEDESKTSVFKNIRKITCGWCQKRSFLTVPVHGLPLSGRPSYPLKHLQSNTLTLPVRLWPEFAGQGWQ